MYKVFDEAIRLDFQEAGEPVWVLSSEDLPDACHGLTMLLDGKAIAVINTALPEEEVDLAFLHEMCHVLHGDHRAQGRLDVKAAEARTVQESEADHALFRAGGSSPTVDLLRQWKALRNAEISVISCERP